MFGNKTLVEKLAEQKDNLVERIYSKDKDIMDLKDTIRKKDFEMEKVKALHDIEIEKAKMEVKKELQEALVKSDLQRVEAVAKLNTYIAMDSKDDRKHIQQMLDKAITGLSSVQKVVIK